MAMRHQSGANTGAMAGMSMDGMAMRDSAGMKFATFNKYSGWPETRKR